MVYKNRFGESVMALPASFGAGTSQYSLQTQENSVFTAFLMKGKEIVGAFADVGSAREFVRGVQEHDMNEYRLIGLDYVDDIGCEFFQEYPIKPS